MAYEFYLDDMRLPVNPSKLKMQISGKNETTTLISGQEINLLRKPGLTQIEFDMLLPQVQYSFGETLQPAITYLNKLEALIVEKKPFHFKILRTSPDGRFLFHTERLVALEDYSITEDASEGLDITVSVKLKNYVEYSTIPDHIQKNPDGSMSIVEQRPLSDNAPSLKNKIYKALTGETLWEICKKVLGDGSRYKRIAELNGITDPNEIKEGQVIRLE